MHSSHKRLARFPMSPTSASQPDCAPRSGQELPREPGKSSARFQPLGLLATGGMGVVHHAYDILMQRHVALKSVRPERADSRHDSDELLHEARLTAQLEHPNIVPVYELVESSPDGPSAFAMRLIHGQNLAEHLAELGSARLAPRQLRHLLKLLATVCGAISYAHRQGILHLDLKADNIMLESTGHVYVMDWGVAVRCARDGQGQLMPLEGGRGVRGTLSHMAPEQLEPNLAGVDERTDVYGLGGVLYQILCGKAPFPANGSKQGAVEARREPSFEGVPEGELSGLLRRLQAVVLRALAPAKKRRFASVSALHQELLQLLEDRHLARPDGALFETASHAVRTGPWEPSESEGTVPTDPGSSAVALVDGAERPRARAERPRARADRGPRAERAPSTIGGSDLT